MLIFNLKIIYFYYREESKPGSDLDEPWIMTVKGINFGNSNKQGAAIMAGDEAILSSSLYKHNGLNNSLTRDANLNHYKVNRVSRAFHIRTPVFEIISNKINYILLFIHEPQSRSTTTTSVTTIASNAVSHATTIENRDNNRERDGIVQSPNHSKSIPLSPQKERLGERYGSEDNEGWEYEPENGKGREERDKDRERENGKDRDRDSREILRVKQVS